jgi:hypothetical protein
VSTDAGRRAALIALVLTSACLVSCGSPPQEPADPPRKALPARPRDIQLDNIDPCQLITPATRQALFGLNDHPSRRKSAGAIASADCTVTNAPDDPGYGLTLRLVTGQGADSYLASPQTTVSTVSGFGALDQPGLNDVDQQHSCLVIVDVSPGQSLWVGFGGTEAQPPPGGYAAMCAKAHIAAEGVMHELLARTP